MASVRIYLEIDLSPGQYREDAYDVTASVTAGQYCGQIDIEVEDEMVTWFEDCEGDGVEIEWSQLVERASADRGCSMREAEARLHEALIEEAQEREVAAHEWEMDMRGDLLREERW